ncbi:maleylpyruvate isomerase family mycothiol-dependent enzyme [Kribbella capetownensis]|uniref:Maleylpyruvate isomerase family mycothiol-dependent enzyme n=1 Tax=Kribbella capetownensis TaxID=1572659 RepID=A0A4R0IXY1_9ACTN|nr:maleylpyruvate isomerase family mycothiol-dependent enzyme [Kribbella capetownensis]
MSDLIDEVKQSARRLVTTAAGLTDADIRGASMLPRWARGHVLVHVARSADAYSWLLRSARGSTQLGSRPTTAPPSGATAPALEVTSDLRVSLEDFAAAMSEMPADAWRHTVTALAGWPHPAWFTLRRCLREVEAHHVDLCCDYQMRDWPTSYVAWALDDTLVTMKARGFPLGSAEAIDLGRTWTVTPGGPAVVAAGHELLGWLAGRSAAPSVSSAAELPVPPPWPQPPAWSIRIT